MFVEPATEPPDGGCTVGRKDVESIIVTDSGWIEVRRCGKTFLVPLANVKHVRL